jgi:hypothetical protein
MNHLSNYREELKEEIQEAINKHKEELMNKLKEQIIAKIMENMNALNGSTESNADKRAVGGAKGKAIVGKKMFLGYR